MTATTVKSMNMLLERPDTMISVKITSEMKRVIEESAASLNMNVSDYIRLAMVDRIEKDKSR